MSVVAVVRDARPEEASALEALHRRASAVWEEYGAQLAAHPDAITPPHEAIAEGRVRVAVDASGRRLGFSVVLPLEQGDASSTTCSSSLTGCAWGSAERWFTTSRRVRPLRGPSSVEVTANPNSLGFYSRLRFEVTGEASTGRTCSPHDAGNPVRDGGGWARAQPPPSIRGSEGAVPGTRGHVDLRGEPAGTSCTATVSA